MSNETNPKKVKQQQYRNIVIIAAAVLLVGWGLLALMSEDKPASNPSKSVASKNKFTSPLEHVDSDKVWIERTENRLADALKKGEETKQQLQDAKQQQQSLLSQSQLQMQEMSQKMLEMQQQIEALRNAPPAATSMPPQQAFDANGKPIPIKIPGEGIREDNLDLSLTEAEIIPPKNPDTYVPSGTFVKAVMIGAADASAAVASQSNPKPMVFRITEVGTLPNHRKSHLKNCTVTAAVVGDISSERGEVRLETLSCVKPNGSILDTPVQGTVFGGDGKNGVRGTPVWREGALIARAAAAGTLSGFSDALAQTYTTTTLFPQSGGSSQSVNSGAVWRYGAARGAGNAMNKLADYYIQRAEQYHPVIQLSAGDTVDIVFLKGFYLDGKKHRENLEVDDTKAAEPTASNRIAATGSPLPLTERQVQRLKERQAELGLKVR